MGNSRARTKHLQELWAQQKAARRAPHSYKSNSKHQPANEQLQLQPAAAEQPQPPEVPVEQQPAVAADAANAVQQEQQQQQQQRQHGKARAQASPLNASPKKGRRRARHESCLYSCFETDTQTLQMALFTRVHHPRLNSLCCILRMHGLRERQNVRNSERRV